MHRLLAGVGLLHAGLWLFCCASRVVPGVHGASIIGASSECAFYEEECVQDVIAVFKNYTTEHRELESYVLDQLVAPPRTTSDARRDEEEKAHV